MGARLEALRQRWRKLWPYLRWPSVASIVLAAIWVLVYVPKMQVPVCPPDQTGLPPKVCFDIENEARKTLAYIMGGLLAIIGITLAHRRIRALERQVQIGQEQMQVAMEGQITERFTRAIEQLGSDRMEVRLGGIYALERIANDSDKDYWPIIETLTAYVRERAPWRESPTVSKDSVPREEQDSLWKVTSYPPEPEVKPATDIQAVLTVLVRRKYYYGLGENQRLDLRKTDLRGAYLVGAHLKMARLNGAHLEGAILSGANLNMAELIEAHLDRAILFKASMKAAVLIDAHLERADLSFAHLEVAILSAAKLKGATLHGAHLEWANLRAAQLEGANLSDTTGLTREELEMYDPLIDENTKLPDYLKEQVPEAKGPEGNEEE